MLTLHPVLQTFLMVLTIKGNLFNNHGLFQLMTFPILSRPTQDEIARIRKQKRGRNMGKPFRKHDG